MHAIRTTIKLLIFFILFAYSLQAQNTEELPYVLIISFDGFRWDYPNRGITPNLDKIAKEGVKALSFEPTFPSKTFPNHLSIVTGMYIDHHGILYNRFKNPFSQREYQIKDTTALRDARWYDGEPLWVTARKNGIISSSYFWPGSELKEDYLHPDYFKYYDKTRPHKERIEGIIHWLSLPPEKRPHLLFLYFSDTDTQGHRYGPESQEVNQAIQLLDAQIGYLNKRLDDIGMRNKINIIILSDHGMTNVRPDGLIKLWEILGDRQVKLEGYGPVIQFFCHSQQEKQEIYRLMKKAENGFKIYRREELPNYFHYNRHPYLGDLIAVADPGYSFILNEKKYNKLKKRTAMGDHGYDNHYLDMHGIFFAVGPAFKKGYQTGTIRNIDVYPLVCKILGMRWNRNIDGSLERIGFILKQ